MIAKGNLHAHGRKLAAYLLTGKKDERAELMEMRGFAADNLRDAFTDVQIQAEGTRATKPFFHCYVRLPEGEGLGREQWRMIADRIEQKLGFDDQPRAVAFHHGPDGTHMHMAWSRIDLETMKAIDPGLYKNKLKEVCRELETELDLTRVSNDRQADNKTLSAGEAEFEQSRRLGTDLKAVRNAIHDCWQASDNGKAFVAALDEHGLVLAEGDKRAFVVIDQEGGIHALSKRITGTSAAATRVRLGDLDLAQLPDVEAARAQQLARAPVLSPEIAATASPRLHNGPQDERQPEAPFANALDELARLQAEIDREAGMQTESEPSAAPNVGHDAGQTAEPQAEKAKATWEIPLSERRAYIYDAAARLEAEKEFKAALLAETIQPDRPPPTLERDGVASIEPKPEPVAPRVEAALEGMAEQGNKIVNGAGKAIDALGDEVMNAVGEALDFFVGSPAPRQVTAAEFAIDPVARQAYQQQEAARIQADRARNDALDRMAHDRQAGRNVRPEDIRNLRRDDLETIKAKGDAGMQDVLRRHEDERRNEYSSGREREAERRRRP